MTDNTTTATRKLRSAPPAINSAPPLNSDELENEIGNLLQRHATPVIMDAVPSNNDLGRMSAEAVLAQYEAAAKSVEEMGNDVKDRIKKLEAALVECDKDLKILAEAATMIREKGKRIQLQIEEASALSNDIRNTCVEFKRKVGVES